MKVNNSMFKMLFCILQVLKTKTRIDRKQHSKYSKSYNEKIILRKNEIFVSILVECFANELFLETQKAKKNYFKLYCF